MANKKKRHKGPDNEDVKSFTAILKLAGWKGGKEAFGKAFLNMSRNNIDYQLKTHGQFDDLQKSAIIRHLENGGFKKFGMTEHGVETLAGWLGTPIPQNRDIIIDGDANAINSFVSNSNNGSASEWKELYLKEREAHDALKVQVIKLESSNETLRETIKELTSK